MYIFALSARDRFQLRICRFRTLAKIDTFRESELPFLQESFASAVVSNTLDDPVTDDRITHAITEITCFRECAKGGDISINGFVFTLISRVKSVPFEGFVQFADGELVELFHNLHEVVFIFRAVELKAIKNL